MPERHDQPPPPPPPFPIEPARMREVRPPDPLPAFDAPLDPGLWPRQLGRMCRKCVHRAAAPAAGPVVVELDEELPAARAALIQQDHVVLAQSFRVLGTSWALYIGVSGDERDPESWGLWAELMNGGVEAISEGFVDGDTIDAVSIHWDGGGDADGCDGMCNWQDDSGALPWRLAHAFVDERLQGWVDELDPDTRARIAAVLVAADAGGTGP